jgi:phosphohistidine phosphatase
MNLYLLRHAEAVERGTPGYEPDATRPLTRDGARRMRRIARGLRALKLDPDVILTSPYLRAAQTAELAAAALKREKKLLVTPHLAPDGEPAKLLAELAHRFPKAKNVMVVGHEPYLSQWVARLIAGDARVAIEFKKGALCKLVAQRGPLGSGAALEWLLGPKVLERLGKG